MIVRQLYIVGLIDPSILKVIQCTMSPSGSVLSEVLPGSEKDAFII